jgi:protein-S-isoprenylcysteine O-methyltransferase Ste14
MSAIANVATPDATTWRHLRAVALLPFMNTVVIPALLLARVPPHALAASDGLGAVATIGGVAFLVCGVALVAHSVRLFVRMGRGTLAPWDPTKALVIAGAYRFSRNPMKAGLFVVLLGEALLFRSVAIAAWLALFATVNVVYIRVAEEPGLLARFGAPYRDYCARVPRWWPSLRALRRAFHSEQS